MKLLTLNYGISTTQAETALMPNPQGNAHAKSKLLCQHQDCFQGKFYITLDSTVPQSSTYNNSNLKHYVRIFRDNLMHLLSKADEPIDWVNSCVCVTKANGMHWLCLEPKGLNCAIKCMHHCTPTLDDVLSNISASLMPEVDIGTLRVLAFKNQRNHGHRQKIDFAQTLSV